MTYTRLGPAAAHVAAITFGRTPAACAGRAQSCRVGRRRPGNVSEVDAAPDTPLLSTISIASLRRHRPHRNPLAVVRWHIAFASWLRSGGIRCADADGSRRHSGVARGRDCSHCEAGCLLTTQGRPLFRFGVRRNVSRGQDMGRPVGPRRRRKLRRNGLDRRAPGKRRFACANATRSCRFGGRASGAPIVIETNRTPAGTLALRGRMVATHSRFRHPQSNPYPDAAISIPASAAASAAMPEPWSSPLRRPEHVRRRL